MTTDNSHARWLPLKVELSVVLKRNSPVPPDVDLDQPFLKIIARLRRLATTAVVTHVFYDLHKWNLHEWQLSVSAPGMASQRLRRVMV